MWTGVTPGDGPQEFHLILLDNGRTAVLADAGGWDALNCIRCSACLNVCRCTSGRAGTRTGPSIGPDRRDLVAAADRNRGQRLPAVRVVAVRGVLRRLPGQDRRSWSTCAPGTRSIRRRASSSEREATAMAAAWVMGNPTRWTLALRGGRLGRALGRKRVIGEVPLPVVKEWTGARDFARPPKQTFRDWWAAERGGRERRELNRHRTPVSASARGAV